MHAFDRRTDGQTDRQTEFPSLYRDCIPCSAVKTDISRKLINRLVRNYRGFSDHLCGFVWKHLFEITLKHWSEAVCSCNDCGCTQRYQPWTSWHLETITLSSSLLRVGGSTHWGCAGVRESVSPRIICVSAEWITDAFHWNWSDSLPWHWWHWEGHRVKGQGHIHYHDTDDIEKVIIGSKVKVTRRWLLNHWKDLKSKTYVRISHSDLAFKVVGSKVTWQKTFKKYIRSKTAMTFRRWLPPSFIRNIRI